MIEEAQNANWEIPNIADQNTQEKSAKKNENFEEEQNLVEAQEESDREWEDNACDGDVGENPCDQHIEESGFEKGQDPVGGNGKSDFNLEMDLLREGVDLYGDREPCLSNVSVVE
jgi:hypothetical protein